jgi:hypothetical protein
MQDRTHTNAKILIVEPNTDLRETLVLSLSEYFQKKNIIESPSGRDALWQATAAFPRYIVMNYTTLDEPPEELLKRLKSSIREFQGIILYAAESSEYETALKTKISHDLEYRGMLVVSYDDLMDKVRVLLARGGAEPGKEPE